MADIDYKAEIEKMNEEMMAELGVWEKLGVDPIQVMIFNPFTSQTWTKALTKFLAEKGIILEDEFILFMKKEQMTALKEMRAQIEPAMQQEKLESLGLTLPDMAIPQGKLRKLH